MKRLKLTAAAEVRAAELAEAHLNNNIAFVHALSVTWMHAMPRFPLTDCSLSGSHMPAFKVDNKVWSVTLHAQLLWIRFNIEGKHEFGLSKQNIFSCVTNDIDTTCPNTFTFQIIQWSISSPQVLNRISHQVTIRSFSEAFCMWKCVMVHFPSWSWHSSNMQMSFWASG